MTYQPGDILLVRDYNGGSDLLGELIMAGERARYGDSQYAVWTHCALIVDSAGGIVEALSRGIERANLSKYHGKEVLVISPPTTPDKRAFAVAFAEAQVGTSYDRLDFVSLAGSLLTGLPWSLHRDRAYICSGLVARATECYTPAGYPYPPEAMMPADLGAAFKAIPGDPLPPLSFIGRLLDKVRAVARAISPF